MFPCLFPSLTFAFNLFPKEKCLHSIVSLFSFSLSFFLLFPIYLLFSFSIIYFFSFSFFSLIFLFLSLNSISFLISHSQFSCYNLYPFLLISFFHPVQNLKLSFGGKNNANYFVPIQQLNILDMSISWKMNFQTEVKLIKMFDSLNWMILMMI